MLYKFSFLNKTKLTKVYHFLYNSFSGRIQGVKHGSVSENKLRNIGYRIRVL
jgi:hypothetical protein